MSDVDPAGAIRKAAESLRLPSGRHQIPDQEVREHQRLRLIDAISALGAERGYANVVIADIVSRAAVSKTTFYHFYRSKEECLFDAHKHHAAALIATIDRACREESRTGSEQLRLGLRSALSHLSAYPQVTRLLSVGILSCGPRGAHRYAVMIDSLSARARRTGEFHTVDSALGAVLLAVSRINYAVIAQAQGSLADLENDLFETFLAIGDRGGDQTIDRIGVDQPV